MSAFTEIVVAVMAEHRITHVTGSNRTPVCRCGRAMLTRAHHQHVAEVLAERLGVTERVEYGVRFADDEIEPFDSAIDQPTVRKVIDLDSRLTGYSRIATTFEHVSDWEACDE